MPTPVILPLVSTAAVPVNDEVNVTEFVHSDKKYVPTPVIVADPLVTATTPVVLPRTVAATVPVSVVLITLTALGSTVAVVKA